MKCRPGDLAVVIAAAHRTNLGRIVRIVELHDGGGELVYEAGCGPTWLVECAASLTWSLGARRIRRKKGPVPDGQLRPIRGGRGRQRPPRVIVISPSIESPQVRIALTSPLTWVKVDPGQ